MTLHPIHLYLVIASPAPPGEATNLSTVIARPPQAGEATNLTTVIARPAPPGEATPSPTTNTQPVHRHCETAAGGRSNRPTCPPSLRDRRRRAKQSTNLTTVIARPPQAGEAIFSINTKHQKQYHFPHIHDIFAP